MVIRLLTALAYGASVVGKSALLAMTRAIKQNINSVIL
jgi:NCAIR mutase (PurE)-related protein